MTVPRKQHTIPSASSSPPWGSFAAARRLFLSSEPHEWLNHLLQKHFPKILQLRQTPSMENFSPSSSRQTLLCRDENEAKQREGQSQVFSYVECTHGLVYVSLSLENVGGEEGTMKLYIQRSAIIISHEMTSASWTFPCSKCFHSVSVPSRFLFSLPLQRQVTLTAKAYRNPLSLGHKVRSKLGFPERESC